MSNGGLPDTQFWRYFQGCFSGLLKWQGVEELWAMLKSDPDGWYVFDPSQDAPQTPLASNDFQQFLGEAERMVNTRRDRPSCGSVYVDDMERPTYIKIFDPAKLGSSCSCSGEPVLPRWIVSQMKPGTLPPPELKKQSIFQRLAGFATAN